MRRGDLLKDVGLVKTVCFVGETSASGIEDGKRTVIPWQSVLIIPSSKRWLRKNGSWMEADDLHSLGWEFLSNFLEEECSCHFGGSVDGAVGVGMHVGFDRGDKQYDLDWSVCNFNRWSCETHLSGLRTLSQELIGHTDVCKDVCLKKSPDLL